MTYDLHMHSTFSDGDLTPLELIELATTTDISTLALTDHDTLSGLDIAHKAASKAGLNFINGVELSCTWNKQLLHVVGLNVDKDNDALNVGIEQNKQRRNDRAKAMIEDFAKHDIDIEPALYEVIEKGSLIARPHFAQALINLGKAKNKKQAFKRYLTKGKPGFIPMEWPSLEEIAQWINGAGGVAVLAHPLRYNLTRYKLSKLIEEMKAAGVQAIEVSTANTDLQQISTVANLAKEHDLYASIGSDFHSYDQPWARLGGAKPLPEFVRPVWELF